MASEIWIQAHEDHLVHGNARDESFQQSMSTALFLRYCVVMQVAPGSQELGCLRPAKRALKQRRHWPFAALGNPWLT